MTTLTQQLRHAPVIARVETTTALVNNQPVVVGQEHRRCSAADYTPGAPDTPERVVVTVSAPIDLSLDDVAAALYHSHCTYENLGDEQLIREMVADMVVTDGCAGLERWRCNLATPASLTKDEVAFLAYCRQRATTIFCAQPEGCHPGVGGARR